MQPDPGDAPATRPVCHPVGAKVITAIKEALDLPPRPTACGTQSPAPCRQHICYYGAVRAGGGAAAQPLGRLLMTGLGPRFTLSLLPLDIF
ncbi:hypothetical protein [Paracoccus contaminans]|uniref:hypothetical protein n=1 Tax=Paracoccus contaminans TaxID=1945662 RepID=UPI0012F4B123|nr:hypothetical protein [Paracoccus contaminans]